MQNQIARKTFLNIKKREREETQKKWPKTCVYHQICSFGWGNNNVTIVLETCLDVAKGKNVTCGFFFHFYTQIHLPFLSSFCSSSSNPLTLLIYLSNKKDLSFVSTILRQKHLAMCFEVSRFKRKKENNPLPNTHTTLF